MFATLLLSVFESIDLSEISTINPQEFMNDPSKLQEHPLVLKILFPLILFIEILFRKPFPI